MTKPQGHIGRRDFLGSTGTALAAAALTGCAANTRKNAAARPNIVIILSDDHGALDMGCAGNPDVRTPNLDQLASQGMRFTRAFTPTAMCTPSRNCLYTGLYPHRNGAHANHSKTNNGVHSLPHFLRPLGYDVVLAGKVHVRPSEVFPFTYLDQDKVLEGAQAEQQKKVDAKDFLGARMALDRAVFGQVEAWLNQANGPFCLVVATHAPHMPYPPLVKGVGYEPSDLTVPPELIDTPDTRKEMAEYYHLVTGTDQLVGDYMALLERTGLADDTLLIYAGDHGSGFPFHKWTLYDGGMNVPFIVRWPGHVSPGTESEALISFVDVTPTLVEAGGGAPPDGLDGKSFLDILHGRARTHHDAIYGAHTTLGIIQGSHYPVRAVRTERYRYIRNFNPEGEFRNLLTESVKGSGPKSCYASWVERAKEDPSVAPRVEFYRYRPPEELYDLEKDPYELTNLANAPEYSGVLQELRSKLEDWMTQQDDVLLRHPSRARELKLFVD